MIIEFEIPHAMPEARPVWYHDDALRMGIFGASDAAIRANGIILDGRAPMIPNGYARLRRRADWFTFSGFRLALTLADARFGEGGEWFGYLPDQLRQAPLIGLEPAESVEGRIY